MKINQTILGFMKKEFIQALRDPRMRMLLFVAPIIQMTLFGVAISSDVKNIRLSTQFHSNDSILQHVYDRSIESKWFIPAKTKSNDPFIQLNSNEADAVLVPPPGGLTNSVVRGHGEIQLLINATNVLRAQSVETYMNAILKSVIQKDMHKVENAPPLQFDLRILYNPTIKTSVFMVPGVMSTLICLITITLTGMSISKEKETGTFEMLLSAPSRKWEIILGKTLPYVILGISNVPLILGVAVLVFNVPMRGSFFVLLVSSFVFVCTTVSIGTLISIMTKTQQQSMMASFLFLFPAIQLSGLTFPLENMPIYMKFLAYLNPLTYFLELLRNIMLKGGDTRVILTHLIVLILMGTILITISFKKFKNTLG